MKKRKIGYLTLLGSLAALLSLALVLRASPARAVDEVDSAKTGGLDVFQLDGSPENAAANADTCVGSETGCTNEENPSWPADWDAMVNPSLANGASTLTGFASPGSAGTFSTPWSQPGAFSGIFASSFINSTSTILKQGSKNSNDISTWVVSQQASPPKDAIVAAAVASFTGPSDAGSY